MSNLCVLGAAIIAWIRNSIGTFRFHAKGQGLGEMCVLGTFSEYAVVPPASVIKADPSTALGSRPPWLAAGSLHPAGRQHGAQPAKRRRRHRGGHGRGRDWHERRVGGPDRGRDASSSRSIPSSRKWCRSLEFGATHTAATVAEAQVLINESAVAPPAGRCLRDQHRLGRGCVRGAGAEPGRQTRQGGDDGDPHPTDNLRQMSLFDLTLYEKQVRELLFGSSNPRHDLLACSTCTAPAASPQARRARHPRVHPRGDQPRL